MGVCKYGKHPFIPYAVWYNSHHLHSISIADTKLAVLPREFTQFCWNQQKLCSWSFKKSLSFYRKFKEFKRFKKSLLKHPCCFFFTFPIKGGQFESPLPGHIFFSPVAVVQDVSSFISDCKNAFLEIWSLFPLLKGKQGRNHFFFPVVYNYEKKIQEYNGTDELKAIIGSDSCKPVKELKMKISG